ncbi:MAG TPA: hypothetical protein VEG42_03615, partial [Thermoplasmata archaeon]|nr:hypothetical protein [Thermoplasmata archaeon]
LAYVFVNDLGYQDFAQVAATWHNRWNISLAPSSYESWVNGIPLMGNVVGAPFLGGNAWSSWDGSIPYTDQGLIVAGGDALPVPVHGSPLHAVVFEEIGLPPGTGWSVSLGGQTYGSNGVVLLAYAATGTYAYSTTAAPGWTPHPTSGIVVVTSNELVWVGFSPDPS